MRQEHHIALQLSRPTPREGKKERREALSSEKQLLRQLLRLRFTASFFVEKGLRMPELRPRQQHDRARKSSRLRRRKVSSKILDVDHGPYIVGQVAQPCAAFTPTT